MAAVVHTQHVPFMLELTILMETHEHHGGVQQGTASISFALRNGMKSCAAKLK